MAVVAPIGKGHWTLDVTKSIETEKDLVTFNSERPEHRVGEGELSEAASNEPVSLSLSVWWWLVGGGSGCRVLCLFERDPALRVAGKAISKEMKSNGFNQV